MSNRIIGSPVRVWQIADDPRISSSKTRLEAWPRPINPSNDQETCYICLSKPIITPVQIQCGHISCNSCLQNILSADSQQSRCPSCREPIYEYISFSRGQGGRYRRPRDKTVPLLETDSDVDDPDDHDYEPPFRMIVGDQERERPSTRQSQSQSQPLDLSIRAADLSIRAANIAPPDALIEEIG